MAIHGHACTTTCSASTIAPPHDYRRLPFQERSGQQHRQRGGTEYPAQVAGRAVGHRMACTQPCGGGQCRQQHICGNRHEVFLNHAIAEIGRADKTGGSREHSEDSHADGFGHVSRQHRQVAQQSAARAKRKRRTGTIEPHLRSSNLNFFSPTIGVRFTPGGWPFSILRVCRTEPGPQCPRTRIPWNP